MITNGIEYLTRLRDRFYLVHLRARFTRLKNIFISASKRTFLSSTLHHDYLLCRNKKYQSYCYSIFVLHVYSSSRAKVWALSCCPSCRFCSLYLSHSIHLSFSFFSPPFFYSRSLAAQFRRSTLPDGKTRARTAARPTKIRFPSRASLRRSVDIAGLLV